MDFIEKDDCYRNRLFLGGPSRARPPAGGAVARESAPPEHFLTRALRALRPAQKKKTPFGVFFFWWTIKGSNLGPTGYEPVALTN